MAFVDLGAQWNIVVALAIAIVKASLVAAYFMHLRHSSGLNLLIAGAGFIWVIHLMVFSFADYLTRGW
jgi:cytochrome c oxidase subunit 4